MSKYINIHTHQLHNSNQTEVISLSTDDFQTHFRFCTLGIHPWSLDEEHKNEEIEKLNRLVHNFQQVIAVGECGIDRAINISLNKQERYFVKQVEISEKAKKPVIIHCVKAWSDLLKWRNELKPEMPWIFHGFNGNNHIARQLIKHGCYLSFGKALLTHKKVQDVFKEQNPGKVFFETDDADEDLKKIYLLAAELKNIGVGELKEIIALNFIKVFNKNAG